MIKYDIVIKYGHDHAVIQVKTIDGLKFTRVMFGDDVSVNGIDVDNSRGLAHDFAIFARQHMLAVEEHFGN